MMQESGQEKIGFFFLCNSLFLFLDSDFLPMKDLY